MAWNMCENWNIFTVLFVSQYIYEILFHKFSVKLVCSNMFSEQWNVSYPIYYFGWYSAGETRQAMSKATNWILTLLFITFSNPPIPLISFVKDLSLYISSKLFMHAFSYERFPKTQIAKYQSTFLFTSKLLLLVLVKDQIS